jgi:SAM-dependent methyltransferase
MAKQGEREYFKKIGRDGVAFTLNKPFSDSRNVGSLLHDIAAVFSLLPEPPAKILDLGCGSGWTSSFYAKACYDVTGIDISADAVRAAKNHFKDINNLRFTHKDYDEIRYKNQFDAVIFFDSLHHAENEVDALDAAYRALKPGGVLIACEPGVGHSKSASSIEAVKKYGVNEKDMPPKLLHRFLSEAGFVSHKTYAYPAIAHRALYKGREGFVGKIRNTSLIRGVTTAYLATFARKNHGIVVSYKPE